MGKLLVLVSCCCILLAVTRRIQAEQEKIESKEEDGLKEFYIKKLYAKVLARRALIVGDSVKIESEPEPVVAPVPEVVLLHDQLQNKLGWGGGGDDGGSSNQNNGPQNFAPPPSNYGPPNQNFAPPSSNYGPPNQNQNNGPPPSQQYGPPAQNFAPPSPNYGPPNQNFAPPSSNYGPPNQNQNFAPPSPNYGPPNQNQNNGPPPSQQYGPPAQNFAPPPTNYGPPNQNQNFAPPSSNYGPPNSPSTSQQYGPPAQNFALPPSNYGPPGGFQQSKGPSQQQQPSQEYGPPQPSQEYGPSPLRVNHGNFGGHIENFKINEAVRNNKNKGSSSPQNQYGPPSFNDNTNNNFKNPGESDRNPKIFKHVYIHTQPPDNDVVPEKRVIRPNTKQDTHYQIIFVKAPSQPQVQTEIEIPPAPERKTLVYVLVKRPEKSEIKFRPAPPTQPPKPEVYFIRYKNKQNQNGGNNNAGGYSNNNENNDLQIQNFQDDLQSQAPLLGGNNDLGNGGYQNEIDSNVEVFNNGMADLVRNALSSGRDIATGSYPNTEYRAQPNMLGPNQEPMSIAVYDKVRNSVTPNPRRADALLAASSNINISQLQKSRRQRQQGSHYTAPGSKPFEKPSGKMVNGHYIGMTSQVLRSKYYTPAEDDAEEGYQPI